MAIQTLSEAEDDEELMRIVDEVIHMSALFITHDIDDTILISDWIYFLAGRPGHIVKEIVIKEPKLRGKDFTMKEEFLNYKKQILEQLHL